MYYSNIFEKLCQYVFLLVDLQLQILGLQGAKSIDVVRIATQNMSNADFAAALSTTALTEAERLRLIAGRQLTDAELEKALATNIASNANVGATATTFSLTNAFNKLGLSIRGVGAAAMSNPITAIITVALTAITVISQVNSHIEQAAAEAEQKAEEAASAIQQINETFKKTSETIEEIGERFAELSQGVDSFTGKNKSLTTDEYAEFLNLSNQLAEMFPTLTRNYDENGNAIVNLSGDVDTIVGSLKNLVEVQREVANQEIVDNLPNLYKGAIKKSREYRIESQTYQEEIDDTISAWEGINGGFVSGNMMSIRAPVDSLEELEKVEQVYLSVLDDLGIVYQYADNIDGIRYKINSFSDMSEKEIEDATAKIESGVKDALLSDSTLNKYFDDSYKKIEEQYGRIIDLNTNKSKAVWNNVTQSIYAWLQTDSTFQVLDDNLQTAIQKMISGIDFSTINDGKGFDTWDELSDYIVTNVIDPISQAAPEVQEALRGLFDIDFATATLSDYFNTVKPYLTAIATALGKTEEEIATMFGLTDQMTNFNALATKRNEILDSFVGDHTQGSKDAFANWLDGLSAGDLEIVYKISTEYTSEKVKDQLEAYQDGGEVNLFLRPKVDNSELKKAGWDVSDDGYATVFTGTYSNTAGTIAANFTPILTDENGNYKGVLSPDEFTRYCEDVLDGVREDDLKLQIGATFDGENAIEEADKAAGEIHILQDYLYDLGDPSNFNLDKWAYALNQFKSAAAEPLSAFNELLNDKGTAKDPHFIDRVDTYIEKINKLNDAYKKFSDGDMDEESFNKLIRDFPTLATRADDLSVAINELKGEMNAEIDSDFVDQFEKMETEDDIAALKAWRDSILNIGKTVTEATARLDVDTSKTQKIADNITKVKKLLDSTKDGKSSLSIDDINSDELKDYRSALEYVNGAIRLNVDEVSEIIKAKSKEQIATNKTNKAMAQSDYIKNAHQIELYRDQLKRARDEHEKLNFEEKIKSLLEENEGIEAACNQYDMLTYSLEDTTDAYQHWLNALEATDYGNIMSEAENAIKVISDVFDLDSDTYNQTGSTKYKAALDFMIPETVDHEDEKALEKYVENLKKYFYFDEDENIAGMDIEKFVQDSLNAGLMVYDQKADEYQVAAGKTMDNFAEGLNLSSGAVQAFFDEMQLYGGNFDWSEEATKTIGDLAIEANKAAEELRKIPEYEKLNFKLDFSDISNVEGQTKAIDREIADIDKIRVKPDIDSSELEYATSILQYLLRQKQALEAPAIMSVDTSEVDEKYRDVISLVQEYQETIDDKSVRSKLGLDTTEVDKQLTEIITKLQAIDPSIRNELGLTTTSKDGIEGFIKNYIPDENIKEVTFKAKTEEVDKATEEAAEPIERDVVYQAKGIDSLPDSFSEIKRAVHYYKVVDGDVDAEYNGTAHASGTAKAQGDWGGAKGGKTLVGELGREIVVDPRTGRWYTVGDNGAEFRDIPKGSIVFNHLQTESLLANGYVFGRAQALVSGTALGGGIGGSSVRNSTSRKNKIAKEIAEAAAKETEKALSEGTSGSSSTESSNSEDSVKYIDRVAILLDRVQRKINNLSTSIKDIFGLWSDRGDGITQQIRNITEEIDIQKGAAQRYLEEANRQIEKYGLDSDWIQSIQDGSLSFAYLTNLDELYEGYQEYQKWYESYLNSRDSIIELEQNLSQLYKDQFDNIKSNYENQISLNDYLYDSNQMTYLQSTTYFEDMQEIYEKNLALSVEEVAELERQLQNAVDSGAIEEGSEAWQDMQKSINDVNKEVSTLNTSLADLFDKRFSNIQSRYGDIIKDLDIVDWDSDNVDYDSHIESQRKSIQLLEEEGIKLTEVLDEAVASKRIQEGSEEWYKMRDGIKGVNKELAEAKTNLADLYVKEASQITSRYDNEIGLLDVIDTDINNTDYEAHLEAQREIIKLSKDEAKELNEVLSKGLASGEIVKGTSSWYQLKDSIDSVTKSAVEAKKQLAELRKQEFDSIQTKFENRLTPYDSDLKFFEWQSSELQANGYVQSSELYQRMQENMRTSMKKTLDQAEAMQESLDNAVDSGEIKLYSDTWYEMKNAIESARQSARNFNLEIDELQKKREDLAKENFNFFQDQLSGRIDENQFYIDLLSKTDMYDKQGRPTDTGLASMALHFDNADLNLNKTRDYQIALDTVNYRISQDPANKELLEYREELIKLQRESILASEKEQEAVIDYVENGIKVELDSLKDLIDKHKDALDSAKELYDYQNKIADKTKNIATIQKQLSAYSLDSSEETKATVQKLKVELENAEKDLSETEYDKSISEQKQLMDTLYTQYETFLNSRLDDTNGILNDMRLVVNALPGEIKGVLDNAAASVGTSLSEEMGTKWQNAADALREWNESHSEAFQVSLDTASSSWGAFGENLRGSVIDQYDYINTNVDDTNANVDSVGGSVNNVLEDAKNLKTAVGRNTIGIESVFPNMEHQTGQIVANNNENQNNVINGLRDVDDATYRYVYRSGDDVSKKNADNLQERTKEIQNYIYENLNNTTTADEVKKIRKLANDVAREANKVTREAEMQTDEAKKQTQLLKGDVDKDGVITSSDALRILRASAGLDTLTDLEKSLADVNGDGVFDSADALAVLRMSAGFGTKKYKKGGLADFTGLAQLDGSKSNPEVVLDPQDSKNLIKLRDLMRKISSEQGDLLELKGFDIAAPQLTALSNLSKGLIGVNNPQMSNTTTINLGGISIDHVQDYNDFMNQMKKDPKFEKLIHSIESDKMTGGNSLSKLNYRW